MVRIVARDGPSVAKACVVSVEISRDLNQDASIETMALRLPFRIDC
jgi:hypothetical protein